MRDLFPGVDPAGALFIGQADRPHDREIESALGQVAVGAALGPQVGGEDLVALGVGAVVLAL